MIGSTIDRTIGRGRNVTAMSQPSDLKENALRKLKSCRKRIVNLDAPAADIALIFGRKIQPRRSSSQSI
jgi:hypothetical protein